MFSSLFGSLTGTFVSVSLKASVAVTFVMFTLCKLVTVMIANAGCVSVFINNCKKKTNVRHKHRGVCVFCEYHGNHTGPYPRGDKPLGVFLVNTQCGRKDLPDERTGTILNERSLGDLSFNSTSFEFLGNVPEFGGSPRLFFCFGREWVIRPMRQVSQFRVGALAVKLHLSKCVSECSLQLIYCTSSNPRYFKCRRSFQTYSYSRLVLRCTDSKIISSKQRREHNLRK